MPYIPGDFWRICDRCGKRFRQSETRKTWDNLWVCPNDFETRQPQDFVRGKADKQAVKEPRPQPSNYFLSDNEVTSGDL